MLEPLFKTPPTLIDPATGTRVWFFDEARTVVDQTTAGMTLEVARYLRGPLEDEVQRRYVSAGKKVRYVHDWTSCTTYDAKARELIIEWGRASHAHTEHVTVKISPNASPFIHIAVVTGISVLRVLKMPIEFAENLDAIVSGLSKPR